MIPATTSAQRAPAARMLFAAAGGELHHRQRVEFSTLVRPGDVVIANDAATIPASLSGVHQRTGRAIEVRLAARETIDPAGVRNFHAVVFGEGDFRMRTEDRPLPPALSAGDVLRLGPLRATVTKVLGHPRLVVLRFHGRASKIWEGLALHGRPIQYSYVRMPLAIWDSWTAIAGVPVAFEAPSAGFAIDWNLLSALRARGVRFETITHVAGISSTGDAALDALLPFDEPYRIPLSTALAIQQAKRRGGRIIAVGTTVVRALEHAARFDGQVRAGRGVADQRLGADSNLRVVDAVLTGTHEPGTSHYELLRAFVNSKTLAGIDRELMRSGYRSHEFGDSIFIEKKPDGECHAALAVVS